MYSKKVQKKMPDKKINNTAKAEKEYLDDAYQGRKIITGR
jgi:hypothetical protein